MKNKINFKLLILLILCPIIIIAQTDDLVTGLSGPKNMVFNGNTMYFTESFGGKVSKINLLESDPNPIDVVTGLQRPWGLAIDGSNLYVSDEFGGTISKIDLTTDPPTIDQLVSGLNKPMGIALLDNFLYVAEFNEDRIFKIDINDNEQTIVDVVTNLDSPNELFIYDNKIFVIAFVNAYPRLFKIEITEANPVLEDLFPNLGESYPIPAHQGLYIKNNIIYSGQQSPFEKNLISVNMSVDPYEVKDLIAMSSTLISGLAFNNDDLYVSHIYDGKITKVDLNSLPETATDVVYTSFTPGSLQFKNDELFFVNKFSGIIFKHNINNYFTQAIEETDLFSGQDINDSVLKEDILYLSMNGRIKAYNTSTSSIVDSFSVTTSYNIYGLAIKDNYLYFTKFVNGNNGEINKVDLTDNTHAISNVVQGLIGPAEIVFNNNDLYISEFFGNKISKIDITEESPAIIEVVSGLDFPGPLAILNNDLFIGDRSDKIYKVDTSAESPSLELVISETYDPRSLAFKEGELYIAENESTITKYDFSYLLSTIDNSINYSKIYPNPVKSHIFINGVEGSITFEIYNLFGKKIKGGITQYNKIPVEDLINGFYILKLQNESFKFIKN